MQIVIDMGTRSIYVNRASMPALVLFDGAVQSVLYDSAVESSEESGCVIELSHEGAEEIRTRMLNAIDNLRAEVLTAEVIDEMTVVVR